MPQEWLRWLNGLVYSLFGADGLVVFSAHPLLYTLLALALLAALAAGVAWWSARRLRRLGRRLRRDLALACSAEGRRALRAARAIRAGGARLRGAVHREIDSQAERRALLQLLRRFTRAELDDLLGQLRVLIARADTRAEHRARALLDRQTGRWAALPDGPERERLQETIAATRQRLARLARDNAERDGLLRGLEEAAAAVHELEGELAGLRRARDAALPAFRDRVGETARQLGQLKQAHRELGGSP